MKFTVKGIQLKLQEELRIRQEKLFKFQEFFTKKEGRKY